MGKLRADMTPEEVKRRSDYMKRYNAARRAGIPCVKNRMESLENGLAALISAKIALDIIDTRIKQAIARYGMTDVLDPALIEVLLIDEHIKVAHKSLVVEHLREESIDE